MPRRRFLIDGDPAKEVMERWARQGVICELNSRGIVITNYSWPEPGTDAPPAEVPTEALGELGEHYDAILSHLNYQAQTKRTIERIRAATNKKTISDTPD